MEQVKTRDSLKDLKATANQNLIPIVEHLAPELYMAGDKMMGQCPIHQGDNISAFNINVDPESDWVGKWFCNSQHCHRDRPNDSLGFILAILQHDNPEATLKDVGEYIRDRFNVVDGAAVATSTINSYLISKPIVTPQDKRVDREETRNRLLIPARYYLNRGFTSAALEHFDVGLCIRPDSEMEGRVIFPVYDENDKYVVGCVGRYPKDDAYLRWKNSKGFNKANHLFNLGKAKTFAEESGTMILVEGQGDVIRLWEAGVYNAVGMFGCSLSYRQTQLLCQAGVFSIILVLDSDKAGQNATEEIQKQYSSMFNVKVITLDKKDVGDMTIQEVKDVIIPQL